MQTLEYSALEGISTPRPVDRLLFLEKQVVNKVVFDLGALDETAYQAKKSIANWLHARLSRSAKTVIGVDNSPLIPDEGIETAHNARIVRANIFDLREMVEQYGTPDIIVAGELIEHLPDTSSFLASMKTSSFLGGVELVVTTPNACCWHNLLIGLAGRESMHKDHLHVYSYKTMRTIFERNGFNIESITPYHARFPEMIEAGGRALSAGVRIFQGMVNALEVATPLLSAGWIVRTRI